MKKIILSLFLLVCFIPISGVVASDLFDPDNRIVSGLDVDESSNLFAEIFEALEKTNFAGRDIGNALESLETLGRGIKIAATDTRIIVVAGNEIIGNWPRPDDGNWNAFGQIATALLLKVRDVNPAVMKMPATTLYSVSIAAMTHALDADGKYTAARGDDGRILTSVGLTGARDTRGYWRVSGVMAGSSAANSGIYDNDLIVAINGMDVAKMSDAEIAAAFDGFNSGTLKLKVATPSGTRDIALRRASVVLADTDIVYRTDDVLGGGILEIIIYNVSENAVKIVNEALNKYVDSTGIILDMRTAMGGDEIAAAKLAGLFIGQKTIMMIDDGAELTSVIPGGDAVTDLPVVVLVSKNTSGAAEGVASAFYDNARGILVGTPTAGNAKLITKIPVSIGGTIELGNRKILSAREIGLDGRGVFPMVCLSNIRNKAQEDLFVVNAVNGDFGARDFNADMEMDAETLKAARAGCLSIKSGATEDAAAAAVASKLLTDNTAYRKLLKAQNVSE